MSAACSEPLGWEVLVDYFAAELAAAEAERIEEHLFGCASCAAAAERVASIVSAFQSGIPVVISAEQLGALKARGVVVNENPVAPGTRKAVLSPTGSDVLIHRLQGLDLGRADRVVVTVRSESTGAIITEDHFVPFDRERGEVLIACQSHFASMPSDIVFDVSAHEPGGQVAVVSYAVPHLVAP
jgi:hypothetical protein